MSRKSLPCDITTIGIDIGKNTFHLITSTISLHDHPDGDFALARASSHLRSGRMITGWGICALVWSKN